MPPHRTAIAQFCDPADAYDSFENRRIKAWLRQIFVQEPAKEQDIVQLFTEDTLAPN